MRIRILISALLTCASVPMIAQATAAPSPSADEVIARMSARDAQRASAAGGYTGNRQYVLDNPRFDKKARMEVRVTCAADGTESFQVVSEQGWKSANLLLRKMLESESETSIPLEHPKNRVTSDNYEFQMIESTPLDGRLAYVIDVIPKRQDVVLFRGRIWVDAEDYALARVEGEPAKITSVWIHSVHFTQVYRKSGEYWFPWSTTSITEARILGKTEVDIHHFDYFPRSGKADRDANPELLEARYAKH
ncbi:MAG: hypothetical protein ACLPY1_06905 [Terracidiphilus sp.]